MEFHYATSRYDTMGLALTAARKQVDEYEAQARRLQAIRAWGEYREARLRCLLNLATVGFLPKTPIVIKHASDAARDSITPKLPAWAAWIRAAGREGRRWDDEMRDGVKPFFQRIDGLQQPNEEAGHFRGRQLLRLAYIGCKMKYFVEYVERAVEDYGNVRGPPDRQDETAFGIVSCLSDMSRSISEIVRDSRPNEDLVCYSAAIHSDAEGAHLLRPGVPILRIDDDITEIFFEQRRSLLRTFTGMRYLKTLVDQKAKKVHSIELVSGGSIEIHAAGRTGGRRARVGTKVLGKQSAQPVTDRMADFQRDARLAALPQEIADAEARGDGPSFTALKEELAELERRRKADTGFAGHQRVFVGDEERARQAVKKAIDDSIDRIEKKDPGLASHFRVSITFGVECSYDPPPPAR